MLVRPYIENDADALTRIWYQATLEAHSFIPKEVWDAHKEDLKLKYLPIAQTWVAEEENKPIGFISLVGNYVGGLFVDPSFHGKGTGSLLMKHVQELNDTLTVSVYKKNKRARSFYDKHGFVYQQEELQEETGEILDEMVWKR